LEFQQGRIVVALAQSRMLGTNVGKAPKPAGTENTTTIKQQNNNINIDSQRQLGRQRAGL
jgi:hypothetical protein